ncbi:MAG: hypothetical protein NC342_03545 [Pseudoflavonifractor sp.]|nr:hypothetical protein [Alloprevotella sp.]MCM1116589.1 hypothetical protein [Pseudoflavonifractor sp.]
MNTARQTPAMVITPHVASTISSLPADEQLAISSALAREFILGLDPEEALTPFQVMVYSMIRSYVCRDTRRMGAN